MRSLALLIFCTFAAYAQTTGSENTGESTYTEGLMHFVLQDYANANKQFSAFLSIQPKSAPGYFMKSRSELGLEQYAKAEFSAAEAVSLDPVNVYYLQHYAETLKLNHKSPEEVYRKWIKLQSDQEEPYLRLLEVQTQAGKNAEALKTVELAEKNFGISEKLVKAKQILLMKENKLEAAIKEGTKLASPDLVLEQARLLLNANKVNEAVGLLEGNLSTEVPGTYILLSELYLRQGNRAALGDLLQRVSRNEALAYDSKIGVLEQAARGGVELVGEAAEHLLSEYPEQGKASLYAGDYRFRKGELIKARDHYKNAVKQDKNLYEVWLALLEISYKLGDWDALLRDADQASMYFPNQGMVWLYFGLAQLEMGDDAGISFEESERLLPALKVVSVWGQHVSAKKKPDWTSEPKDEWGQYLVLKYGESAQKLNLAAALSARIPNNHVYKYLLAEQLLKVGRVEDGLQALSFVPEVEALGKYYEVKGDLLAKSGKREEAKQTWAAGAQRYPKNKQLQERIKSM
jgi:predicted Zn-dependent protease